MTLRNHDIAELRRLDVAHHLPAQQDWRLQRESGGSRIITRGEGCYVWDGEGNQLLDGMAGLWCVQVGYGRDELAQAAYEQMTELPYYNTYFRSAAPSTVTLAAKVAELAGHGLGHVFFNSSGSEANDTVIRIVRHYWQVKGEPERTWIISRDNGYHGSTIAGISLGGMTHMQGQGGPWVPHIAHIMQPNRFTLGFGEDPEAFGARAAAELEAKILEIGPERVAAFVGEPVQGAGGAVIPPDNYWPRIEAICRKYGILLVCDEVICGFGRLGRWFGFQHYGIRPDLIAMAKGISSGYLPISAVAVQDEIVETLREPTGIFYHGYTYSGHPTCAAVALKNIEILEREDLPGRTARDTGPYLGQALATLNDHPLVGETRSLGLIAAVEIVSKKGTNERFAGSPGLGARTVVETCLKNGLVLRAGREAVVMSPPLTITRAQIDDLVTILRRSLDEAEPVLRAG